MRLTIVLILTTIMHINASTFAQRITFIQKEATFLQLFKQIKKQTGYNVLWNDDKFDVNKAIKANFRNTDVNEVMSKSLQGLPFTYTVKRKTIIIKEKHIVTADLPTNNTLNIDVTGTVHDDKGIPLAGATVTIKNQGSATVTDENGQFTLKGIDENAILLISYLGYQTLEVKARADLGILMLSTRTDELAEVEVLSTGYQVIPKDRATGSFVQLNSQILNRRVSTGILARIEDTAPGLIFSKNNSNFNSSSSQSQLSIRGQSTIIGKADPLIVIDNFPYDGDLNSLNPNDVESITILKDAAAASIWGARAGNGVIVITTKKAKAGQPLKMTFNSNLTHKNKPDLFYLPQMSSSEFIDIERQLFSKGFYTATENSRNSAALTPAVELMIKARDGLLAAEAANAQIDILRNYDTRRDLDKYAYRSGLNQQYAFNIAGSGSRNRFYLSAGYDHNQDNIKGGDYSRLTLQGNNTFDLIKGKLELTLGMYLSMSTTGIPYTPYGGNYTVGGMPFYPYARLADDNGNPLAVVRDYRTSYAQAERGMLDWQQRPLQEMEFADNTSKLNEQRLNLNLSYQILPGLKAEGLMMYNSTRQDARNLQSLDSYFTRNLINTYTQVSPTGMLSYPVPKGAIVDTGNGDISNLNLRTQLNYNQQWAGRHELSVLAGTEMKDYQSQVDNNRIYGYNEKYGVPMPVAYLTPYKRYFSSIGATSQIPFVDSSVDLTDRYLSYYTTAGYTYLNRYTFTASARQDKSNLFGVKANEKGVPLYSAGLAWSISQEPFFKIDQISNLKLRATYGYNGNVYKNISAMTTASLLNSYSIGQNTGLAYAQIINPPNPQLKWERVRMFNLGLDFTGLNSRLSGSLEYYKKHGLDLIGTSTIDPTSGVSSFTGNSASTKGDGIDFIINSRNLQGALTWESAVIASYSKNIVSDFNTMQAGQVYISQYGRPLAGRPLLAHYSYPSLGLDPLNGNPISLLEGQPSTEYSKIQTAIAPETMIYNGPAIPVWFGSFRNTFGYKNISVSMNIAYRLGYYFRKQSVNYNSIMNGTGGHGDFSLRWQKTGDELQTIVPSIPAAQNVSRHNVYTYGESLIGKADHIRFQDLQVNYSWGRNQAKGKAALPFQTLQVYAYANNLGLAWKANKFGIDPDYQLTGPPPMTLSLGVKMDL